MKRLARGVLACVDPRGRREDDVELGGIAKPKPREPKEPDVTAEAKSGAEKMRADLRAIAPEHARGTRRARVLLATTRRDATRCSSFGGPRDVRSPSATPRRRRGRGIDLASTARSACYLSSGMQKEFTGQLKRDAIKC